MLSDPNFPPGPNQAFPLVRLVADLAGKQDLNLPPQEIARSRISRANRLRFQAGAPSIQACGKYPRVVKD